MLPVNSKVVVEAENAKVEYEYKLNKMKEMIQNTDMDDKERETLIYNTGLEAKYLLEVIDEYKSARRHISNDKRRI